MPEDAVCLPEDRLRRWWSIIAPACTTDELAVSVDLWALLHRAWSLAPDRRCLPLVLGQTYERELATTAPPHTRKRQGSYYTPEAIAQAMVAATVGPACSPGVPPPAVLDPACGGGIFLVLAYRYLHQHQAPSRGDGAWLAAHLFGVDIDPNAVAVTRLALGLAALVAGPTDEPPNLNCLSQTIRCGNALINTGDNAGDREGEPIAPFPWPGRQFDVVIGNPPYLDAEAMTRHFPHWRAFYRSRYQTAQGNWDLFCLFIERALQLCRAGGWHSFVVPNKLASAEYARPARSLLAACRIDQLRDYSRVSAFPAAVYPLVYVVQTQPAIAGRVTCTVMGDLTQISATYALCRSRFSGGRPWCLLPSQHSWLTQMQQGPLFGDVLQVIGASSVAEAYQLRSLIQEQPQPTDALKLVNSGTIDRYRHSWGRKQLRYLGDRYWYPVVSRSALVAALPKRYRQATSPKLIIAGLTRGIECVWDGSGVLLPGKSTTVVLLPPSAVSLGPVLLGILNSSLMTAYFRALFSGNALQGGYLRIGPPQVRSLPLPPGFPWSQSLPEIQRLEQLVNQRQALSHDNSTAALDALDGAIDRLACTLYGVETADIDR